ncbi:MAG TPA: M14 family zinc carboxypeptidase [Pyrinomonadaceae bacterium]|nr:M14 family zinc carboxypeptidase [Pyrinomonadaceae bacterium]
MIQHGRVRPLLLLAALFVLSLSTDAPAQRDDSRFDFYARGPYREQVPRPQTTTRFDVGDFHTNYATMERVIERIAQAAPDRVRVTDIGETNEHRSMHLVVISAPENLQRLDQIKANIARLADPRTTNAQEAARIAREMPIISFMSYTIHGNESASFEAMMQVVYQLAASNEPATLDILKNSVVVVNVCSNPDGHERFVTWYNSFGTGNPDPLASEHREPWSVWGRGNHYRFDLNRDNLAATQIETRNLQRAYLDWNPQIFVDHHGQPSQYFFPPAALPVNPNLPPAQTTRWLTEFDRANAAQFDARNWDYYVRDVFDLFGPFFWDSWPALNGATGMTYETDGGGTKGYAWRRDDDTIVTLRSAIAKHFIASLTTLEVAARNREARLKDFYEFKQSAIEEGRREPLRRIVIVPGRDPARAADLADVLLRAGIEVSMASEPFRSASARAYTGGAAAAGGARTFPAGSYVVELAQPQKRLAKALLEPDTELDPAFVRDQLARFARNGRRGGNAAKEEYGFYDVTAWALPFVFGVEAYWTGDAPAVASVQLRAAPPAPETTADALRASGERLLSRRLGVSARASVAYIIPYETNGAASLAYRLLRENYKLAVATRTLNAGGRDWPRGTIVVRVSRNPDTLHEALARLAREAGVEVTAVNSGFAESGDTSIGSENVLSLKRPRIIVVADEPVSQTGYGAIWWTFERYGVDFTPMTIANLRRANLDQYNVIIMPDGSAGGYLSALSPAGVSTLRAWVQRGGTLVCIKGAAVFAALKEVNLTSSRLVGSDDDEQRDQKTPDDAEAGAATTPTPAPSPATPEATTAREQQATARNRRQAAQTATEQQRDAQDRSEKLDGAPPDLPPIASPSAKPGRVPEAVPGAIFRATLDRSTPLTYGYEDPQLPVLVDSAYFFRPSKEGTNAVVFTGDGNQPLRLAGFIWPNNTERLLRGTAHVIEEPTGRGHVVLYAEDPNYRGFWRATTRLFFNSFLFQPTF